MSSQNKPRAVIGVDIGGVIIAHTDDKSDTSFFSKNYLQTPACDGVFAAIRTLIGQGCDVHLVSKCGDSVEGKSRKWLATNRFYEITGVEPTDVHFCRERADKAVICTTLGVSHFVDDRLEVLSYLTSVPHRFLFDPNPIEVNKFQRFLPVVQKVSSWAELMPLMLATLTPQLEACAQDSSP